MGSEGVKVGGGVPRWLAIVGAIAALLASLATIVGLLINAGIIPRPSASTSIVNSFTYNAATNTLSDQVGEVWTRRT
jgi:hypothetical protein